MKSMKLKKGLMMVMAVLCLWVQNPVAQGGTQTGKGTVPTASDLLGYCNSAIGYLVKAKRIAREQFGDGDLVHARATLINGLVQALGSFGDVDQANAPLTRLAIQRGLDLDTAFQNGCSRGEDRQSCLELEQRTALYFMGQYYNYILGVVSELDRDYYVPYMTRYGRCGRFDCMPQDFGNDFFVAYRNSASALLNFYNGQDPNSGLPDALAKDVYELNVAERVLGWAAQDLNQDLWRRHFACLIQELSSGAQDLAAFNSGDTQRFKTSRRAVLFARDLSYGIASDLNNPHSCVVYPRW